MIPSGAIGNMSNNKSLLVVQQLVENTTTTTTTTTSKTCSNGADPSELYVNLSSFWYIVLALVTTGGLLVSLISNAIIIYLFYRTPSLRRSPSNIVAVNLSLSDLLYCTQWPSVIYCSLTRTTWILEIDFICQTFGFITVSTASASVLTVLCMSLERAIVISQSIHVRDRFTIRAAWLATLAIWSMALLTSFPPFLGKYNQYTLDPSKTSCTLDYLSSKANYKLYIVFIYVLYWILPAIIITICYAIIITAFRRSSRSLRLVASDGTDWQQHHQQHRRQQMGCDPRGSSSTVACIGLHRSDSRWAVGPSITDDGSKLASADGSRAPWLLARRTLSSTNFTSTSTTSAFTSAWPSYRRRGRLLLRDSIRLGAYAVVGSSCRSAGRIGRQGGGKQTTLGADKNNTTDCQSFPSANTTTTTTAINADQQQQQQQKELKPADRPLHRLRRSKTTSGPIRPRRSVLPPASRRPRLSFDIPENSGDLQAGHQPLDAGQLQSPIGARTSTTSSGTSRIEGDDDDDGARSESGGATLAGSGRLALQRLHSNLRQFGQQLRKSGVNLATSTNTNTSTPTTNAQLLQKSRQMLQVRLAKMSFYLIVLWLISWTPIATLAMINSLLDSCHHQRASATAVFLANTMTKLGPTFDVFIYGISHPKIKSKFMQIVKWLFLVNGRKRLILTQSTMRPAAPLQQTRQRANTTTNLLMN